MTIMASAGRQALRFVPSWIAKPSYAITGVVQSMQPARSKSLQQYERLREAGRLAATVRAFAGKLAKAGSTTDEIDRVVHEEIIALGAYPSPLNYSGFPKSICTSINTVLCHGIPDQTVIKDGDIIKIDVSLFYNGVHGDCCGSFVVGSSAPESLINLAAAAKSACFAGIATCHPGSCISDIGVAIENHAQQLGYSVSEIFSGHGIGDDLHEQPFIIHTRSSVKHERLKLEPAMVFTVEPILVEGDNPRHYILQDGWTAESVSRKPASQHEEMVGITESGFEVFTNINTDSNLTQ